MNLVLFGMQGSGKGTQSQRIAERCGFKIFEAGAELRKLAKQDSPLAQKVKAIMEEGRLVPTEVVMEIIAEFLHSLPEETPVLFDGIPRSADQRDLFDALMKKEGREFKGLLIEITEEEALRRLTTRRICRECKSVFPAFYEGSTCENCGGELMTRKDDTPDAIRVRLDTFRDKTQPVIEDYKAQNKMITINGEQDIEDVTSEIMSALDSHNIPCQ